MKKYIPSEIEGKWQKKWEDDGVYASKIDEEQIEGRLKTDRKQIEHRLSADKKQIKSQTKSGALSGLKSEILSEAKSGLLSGVKYYILAEFPYPSGDLHMGHWFTWGGADIFARLKRMQGFNVFFPCGFDAFGLPAENAAIKRNIHPRDWTFDNIARMKDQFATMGSSFTFDHEVITCLPNYYKWNQWIFLKMLEKGVAYKDKFFSNWCPSCQTVLANEGVENGKCWRCGSEVEQKAIDQWFLRITDYAERLLWPQEGVSSQSLVAGSQTKKKATDHKLQATSYNEDWPQSVREGQNAWIGKSEGVEIRFEVVLDSKLSVNSSKGSNKNNFSSTEVEKYITVFTSYPETIFGVTFLAIAPEHPVVTALLNFSSVIPPKGGIQKTESAWIPDYPKGTSFSEAAQVRDDKEEARNDIEKVKEYVEQARKKSELDRKAAEKDKTGVFTGLYCINPVNGQEVPVWVADYVLAGYGTGAVMGVPGSDHRDFAFAKTYSLPISRVIGQSAKDADKPILSEKDVLEKGILVNSGQFSGLSTPEPARENIKEWLAQNAWGLKKVQYHLHDWSISRQRYWGTPIPVIYCKNCAIVPVPYDQLPVELPYNVDYTPKGKSPLASNEEWLNVKCPVCGESAKRDADTMDTFIDSSWYFFRYLSPHYNQGPFDRGIAKRVMSVDIYFGGAEHTLGHTLYSRFFTKFFKDLGLTDLEEYATRRVNHGIVLGPDGNKMSKSKGNVVNPEMEVKKFGADAVRVYLAFFMPYEGTGPWISDRIWGAYKFLERVWNLFEKVSSQSLVASSQTEESVDSSQLSARLPDGQVAKNTKEATSYKLQATSLYHMHRTIKKVTEDIESIKFNTALAALMEWMNYLSKKNASDGGPERSRRDSSEMGSQAGLEVSKEEYKTLLLLLAPFAPHIAEELWQKLLASSQSPVAGSQTEKEATDHKLPATSSIHTHPWPKYEEKYLVQEKIKLAVQVNGKVRDIVEIDKEIEADERQIQDRVMQREKIQKFVDGKVVKKTIYIPGKIFSIVVS